MLHVYSLEQASLQRPSIVTIGVFDGVHRGHQHLIKRLVYEAHSADLSTVVLTFYPHPDVVLRGLTGRYYLTTPEQRAEILADWGIDLVVTHVFDEALRQVRAADFVDQLVHYLQMTSLWIGSDFALGYKREGNVATLRHLGAQKGFSVHVIDLIMSETEAVSSTLIREAIETGAVSRSRDWLGRAYTVTGEVVHGEKRGRKIGFPTANVQVWDQQVIPANGVYAGWASFEGSRYMAVTNVGVRPTFSGEGVTVEAHLLDFDGDLYGKQLEVSFETRLREEKRFASMAELIGQITADVVAGRAYLSG